MKLFITFLFIWFALCINAQNHHEDHSHNSEERHSIHEHTKSELGVAGIASLLGDGDFAPGIHLHYTYAITEPIGIGLGFEQLFGEHQHQTFSLVLSYRPIDRLTFALSPGITVEKEVNESKESRPSIHLEAIYEFEINGVHLGPLIEYAWDKEEYHVSVGLHIGIGW